MVSPKMLIKIIKRCAELKFSGCIQALNRRAKKKWLRFCHKIKISKSQGQNAATINIKFIEKIINSPEFRLYLPQKFQASAFQNNTWILQQADLAAQNCFDLLGSGQKCFTKIPWQLDFKSPDFKSNSAGKNWDNFYQDITASCPADIKLDEYSPDVKVPWELSRFQHIFVLGSAQQISKEDSPSKYAKAFQDQISDWIDSNPYLMGVNWACPMDVAIRAINWIWGFYFFKNSCDISPEFWEKFVDSLYKHMQYLEFNWETSDRPNNHYISDLIGYLYLCEFFDFPKKRGLQKKKAWCVKTILEQFSHQINPDGTCYEGSTNYHRLDTELFLHFKLICAATQTPLPQNFLTRFIKMIEFMQDCTDSHAGRATCSGETCSGETCSGETCSGNFVSIGDNDSGKILTEMEVPARSGVTLPPRPAVPAIAESDGWECFASDLSRSKMYVGAIAIQAKAARGISNYPDFGLLIIKKGEPKLREPGFAGWHVTFRYPTYKKNQPTGHFHHDELAVTFSIGGVPILVDAGTYVYTANGAARNLMRSAQSHNTFYCPALTGQGQIDLRQTNLFALDLTPQDNMLEISETDGVIQAMACNKMADWMAAYRKLELDSNQKNLKITDWVDRLTCTSLDCTSLDCTSLDCTSLDCARLDCVTNNLKYEWNLVFNPELELKKELSGNWLVTKNNKIICQIISTLDFVQTEGFYSKNYGHLQICPKLVAAKDLSCKNLLNKNLSNKDAACKDLSSIVFLSS